MIDKYRLLKCLFISSLDIHKKLKHINHDSTEPQDKPKIVVNRLKLYVFKKNPLPLSTLQLQKK